MFWYWTIDTSFTIQWFQWYSELFRFLLMMIIVIKTIVGISKICFLLYWTSRFIIVWENIIWEILRNWIMRNYNDNWIFKKITSACINFSNSSKFIRFIPNERFFNWQHGFGNKGSHFLCRFFLLRFKLELFFLDRCSIRGNLNRIIRSWSSRIACKRSRKSPYFVR